MKHLYPLTSLRFFAAFIVLCNHFRGRHEDQLPAWLWNIIGHGFVGVNLFFVLSGFVIAYNYGERFRDATVTYWEFMVARFARIWPAFVFALLLALPVFVFRDADSLAKLPLMLVPHLTLMHAWFPNLGESWLFPSWTIGTEWGFYLLFPLYAAYIFRLREPAIWAILLVSAALTFMLPVLYAVEALQGIDLVGDSTGSVRNELFINRLIRWTPLTRLPEFLVGVCVCRIFLLQSLETRRRWAKALGPLCVVTLALALVLMARGALPHLVMNQAALTLPFAMLVLYLAYNQGLAAKWLSWPTLVLFGEASYSLYLIHPVVRDVVKGGGLVLFGIPLENLWMTALLFPLSIGASVLIFKYIEKPARRRIVAALAPKRVTLSQVDAAANRTLEEAPLPKEPAPSEIRGA